VKLNAKSIEAVQPNSVRAEYLDHIVPSLRLVVQPSGIKSFQLRYRWNGKQKRLALGRVDKGLTLADARDKAREHLQLVEDGIDPSHKTKQIKEENINKVVEGTISSLLNRYEAERLSQLKSKGNALTFLREFRSEFGDLEINNFTKTHFTNLTSRFVAEGKGTKANRVHTHIKTFYNWAIGVGVTDTSPCDRVPKPFKEQSKERFLLDDEIKLFWRATESDLEPWGHLYRFLLLTGQRLNEAAYMTDAELLEADHWHLSSSRTKNALRHDVFLSSQAQQIINRNTRIAGNAGFVFTTTGKGAVRSFDKPNKRLRKRMNELAGRELKHFTPHDLRRTCETGLAMLGTPQPVIDRITNHITGRGMARVYNMYDYRNEKAEALQKWADRVEGLVG
jgi:integrase